MHVRVTARPSLVVGLSAALLSLLALVAAAHAGKQRTSAHCSHAAAVNEVLRHHLESDPSLRANPVFQVLCGSFLDPGVETMVASQRLPSCGAVGGWVVFAWRGGSWQLVYTSYNGAFLHASGHDIVETQNVLRPSDAHCFPTGGKRSRVRHWNGSTFPETDWRYTNGAMRVMQVFAFRSPSLNLFCHVGDDELAVCDSLKPPLAASLRLDGTFSSAHRSARASDAAGPVLEYGQQDRQGGFLCDSSVKGITCRVELRSAAGYGKGFTISTAGVTKLG